MVLTDRVVDMRRNRCCNMSSEETFELRGMSDPEFYDSDAFTDFARSRNRGQTVKSSD
jgi:hypothetical protein